MSLVRCGRCAKGTSVVTHAAQVEQGGGGNRPPSLQHTHQAERPSGLKGEPLFQGAQGSWNPGRSKWTRETGN